MKIKSHIPNTITSLNFLCGVFATVCAVSGHLQTAAILIFCGAVFDFFDGFVARLLKVSSDIGKELDSLADVVSFGIAPAAMYSTYVKTLLTGSPFFPIGQLGTLQLVWTLAPFILAAFAALRLAKFNIDTRQTENFLGLTTTATGLLTASLMWAAVDNMAMFSVWLRPSIVIGLVLFFCVMLVSEVPMFSLKIKHFTWKGNELRFILLGIGLLSIIFLGMGGIAVTIFIYILFSLVRYAMD